METKNAIITDATIPFRVLSLGAGVQSSTVAMMMRDGEIEKAAR